MNLSPIKFSRECGQYVLFWDESDNARPMTESGEDFSTSVASHFQFVITYVSFEVCCRLH